jgi:phosphonate transport system substrate-binding protein
MLWLLMGRLHTQHTIQRWIALLCLLTGTLVLTATQAQAQSLAQSGKQELVIGIFPRRPATQTQSMFRPLAEYLQKSLQRPVRLEVPPDFPAFWKAVSENRYQLVHYNQYHYVRSHKEFGYRVAVMNNEFGDKLIRGTLWVRKDSGIKTAADLKHQKIVFGGGKKAMVSYIVATDLLRQAGLQDGDYVSQFTINPTHAMMAVYYRQGIAAGLNLNAPKQVLLRQKINFDEMMPLLVAEPIALHPWAVSTAVSPQLQADITTALLKLNDTPDGLAILKQADLTGLSPANDADYDPHRRIIERVLAESY